MASCNSLKEIDPPSQAVPDQVIAVVKKKYPRSSELLLETQDDDRIWTASFVNDFYQYRAVVDRSSFLANSRLLRKSLPDSLQGLLGALAIGGGTFDGLREISPDSAGLSYLRQFATNVTINGNAYTLRGTYLPSQEYNYYFYMTPRAEWEYPIGNLATMPDPIRNFIQQRTALSEYFQIYVSQDQKKTYVSSNVIFNDSAEPVYSLMGGWARYMSWAEVPLRLREYVAGRMELTGFSMSSGYSFTDGAVRGYKLSLRKEHSRFSEVFDLYFNIDSKLIYETYSAYVKPE